MKPSTERILKIVFGFVVVAAVLVNLLQPGKATKRPPAAADAQTTLAPVGNTSTPDTSNSQDAEEKEPESLQARVQGLLAAYYQVEPADTEEVRSKRVQPFVHEQVFEYLDFGLSEGTPANDARIRERLSVRGTAVMEQLRIGPSARDEAIQVATVPVQVVTTRPDGREVNRLEVQTDSLWVQVEGEWFLIDFTDQRR